MFVSSYLPNGALDPRIRYLLGRFRYPRFEPWAFFEHSTDVML